MELKGNTILITGGGSGIGFALASRFAKAGSKVVICGRRLEQLEEAKKKCPELIPLQADTPSGVPFRPLNFLSAAGLQ